MRWPRQARSGKTIDLANVVPPDSNWSSWSMKTKEAESLDTICLRGEASDRGIDTTMAMAALGLA